MKKLLTYLLMAGMLLNISTVPVSAEETEKTDIEYMTMEESGPAGDDIAADTVSDAGACQDSEVSEPVPTETDNRISASDEAACYADAAVVTDELLTGDAVRRQDDNKEADQDTEKDTDQADEEEDQDTEKDTDQTDEEENGDLTADEEGIVLEGEGVFDVFISGTLRSGKTPVLIDESVNEDNVSITVWKIESPVKTEGEEHVVLEKNGSTGIVTDHSRAVESGILYIIKVEPSQKEIITLSGTKESHGCDTAKQGEIVTMKVSVPDGYRLTGAYNGYGEKIPLKKNADGDYFIEVPVGGGVYLSAELEKTGGDPDSDDDDDDEDASDSDSDRKQSIHCISVQVTSDECDQVSDGESVNIIFDFNGGTLHGDKGPVRIKAVAGEEITLLEAPVKQGARFVHWRSSCSKITVDMPGDTFVAGGSVTFTAVWDYDGSGRSCSNDDDDEDDDDDDDEEDGPDVTETVIITEDNEEEKNIGSITVQDDPAAGIRITASQDVDVNGAISVIGGGHGADGIYAEASGRNVDAEVETGRGMTVRSSDGGSSCGIRASAGKDGELKLQFEGNAQSDGKGAILHTEKDGKIKLIIGDSPKD